MNEECFFTKCDRTPKHTIKLMGHLYHSYCELHFMELKMEGMFGDVNKEQRQGMRKRYYALKYGER